MKRIIIRHSTEMRTKPSGSRIRNLFKNEIVESSGMPIRYNDKLWIKVKVLNGPMLTGYVMIDDTDQIIVRRNML